VAAKEVPITPEVLAWAIGESGYDRKAFAETVGVEEGRVDAWLTGEERPGVTQWRKLATVLRRPTATFLLPAPPRTAALNIEFRHPPGREERPFLPVERIRLREAIRLQRGLRWVADELQDARVRVPKFKRTDDAEAVGRTFRDTLKVTSKAQIGWKSEYVAFRAWRDLVEDLGVVVLALPMGDDAARGFSIWDDLVPVIAINTHWNPSARIFTLFHELGHLVTRTSSMCEETLAERHKDKADPVERWCETFAAGVLIPWRDAEGYLVEKFHWNRRSRIADLAVASSLSRRFKVSLRATVLRLIGHGFADWSLYNSIPKTTEQKPDGGGGGGGRTRPEARRDEYGNRTAGIFRRGLERDVVGRDEVLGYVNIGDQELKTFLSPSSAA
jgi:Zn-dependent peptidase ImmA (M78 family)